MKPVIVSLSVLAVFAAPHQHRANESVSFDTMNAKSLDVERGQPRLRLPAIELFFEEGDDGQPTKFTGTVEYLLPDHVRRKKPNSSREWGLAAPVVNGFSDPNRIVYDAGYIEQYVSWALNSGIACGGATYRIDTPEGVIEIQGGADNRYLGRCFRADDLIRFLKTRTEGEHAEWLILLGRSTANGGRSGSDMPGRLGRSPWERDFETVRSLLAAARYQPAYPQFKALLKDPSPSVRRSAIRSLGCLAPENPKAVKDLAELLPDRELGDCARDALAGAGEVALPIFHKALNHPNPWMRGRAVYGFAKMYPFDLGVPGLLAALKHEDIAVRKYALSALLQVQGRGTSVGRDDIVDALALALADDDYGVRRIAVAVLEDLKADAARARPALLKAAEDPSWQIHRPAQEALKAIDAAETSPKESPG